jgi:hypothetical protein
MLFDFVAFCRDVVRTLPADSLAPSDGRFAPVSSTAGPQTDTGRSTSAGQRPSPARGADAQDLEIK